MCGNRKRCRVEKVPESWKSKLSRLSQSQEHLMIWVSQNQHHLRDKNVLEPRVSQSLNVWIVSESKLSQIRNCLRVETVSKSRTFHDLSIPKSRRSQSWNRLWLKALSKSTLSLRIENVSESKPSQIRNCLRVETVSKSRTSHDLSIPESRLSQSWNRLRLETLSKPTLSLSVSESRTSQSQSRLRIKMAQSWDGSESEPSQSQEGFGVKCVSELRTSQSKECSRI